MLETPLKVFFISNSRSFYFMLGTIFHLRSLQITGYFGVKKTKVLLLHLRDKRLKMNIPNRFEVTGGGVLFNYNLQLIKFWENN